MRTRYEYSDLGNGVDDESLQTFLNEGAIGAYCEPQTHYQKCQLCTHESFMFQSPKYGLIDIGNKHMQTKLLMCASLRCKSAIPEGKNKFIKV